jgi:hypothetical protein
VLGSLILVLAVGVIALALLATGWPQRRIIATILGNALNAEIQIGKVSTLGRVQISDLKAFAKSEGTVALTPMIDLSGLDLEYRIWPADGHYVPALTIDKLGVRLDRSAAVQAAPAETKPAAPMREKRKGKKKKGFDLQPFIPRTVDVNALQVEAVFPSLGMALDGLQARGAMDARNGYMVGLSGDHVSGSWWMGSPSAKRDFKDGVIDVGYKRSHDGTSLDPLRVLVPGLIEIVGAGHIHMKGGKRDIDFVLTPTSPEQFGSFIKSETEKFGKVIKSAGMHAE